MYERLNRSAANALAYRITRPLERAEMQQLTDELEGSIAAAGKIRVLLDLQAFPYADLGVLWEDLKFDVKYARQLERLALVGGGKVEQWSTRIFGLLTLTRSRCFEAGQLDAAWDWLVGN